MSLNIDLVAFSNLLSALYGAATTNELNNKHFLTQLKHLLNLQHATLIVRQPTTTDPGLIYTSGQEGDIALFGNEEGAYGSLYIQDPLVNLPLKQITTIDDITPRDQLIKSEYYELFLKPFDIYYAAGIDWLYEKESRISIRFTREQAQGPFTDEEKSFFTLLIPHLEQSVALGIQLRQLNSERQIYADSIAKRSMGIITLDKTGNILQSNKTAENYLSEGDGFKEFQNRIKINNSSTNEAFNKNIAV